MSELQPTYIGMDIGGSHVSGTIVLPGSPGSMPYPVVYEALDTGANAGAIVGAISGVIRNNLRQAGAVRAIGIAMPGPFNYPKGISEIHGVGGKFRHTFGLHMAEALRTFTPLPDDTDLFFANDAHCFGAGTYHVMQLSDPRVICITLGTGFGSAFLEHGVVQEQHQGIPPSGAFYDVPFGDAIADAYFSTRWFVQAYREATGNTASSVRELAELAPTTPAVQRIFEDFGKNLATFLAPWLMKFACDTLVMGGNISKAWPLFGDVFSRELEMRGCSTRTLRCPETENITITGAALLAAQSLQRKKPEGPLRKTTQPLLPLRHQPDGNGYDPFPAFEISEGNIQSGFDNLAKAIATEKTIVIDGYGGIRWDDFRRHLNKALLGLNVRALWYDMTACLKPPADVAAMIAPSLNGDDPVFGKRFEGRLADFFDPEKLTLLHPDDNAPCCIVYGTGAALSRWNGPLLYLDVPKNEIQYRMRAGSVFNLGATTAEAPGMMYKRAYFVDWPVLNRHKQSLLPRLDYVVDEQRVDKITWMRGSDCRQALDEMLHHSLRARPWFEAGVWGGSWMKEHLRGIVRDEVNYAWSFELITPENGIVLTRHNTLLELSFDWLLFHNHEQLLGKAARRFGTEFPIRFDFLDTFDGGNLSIQCHPRPEYIRAQFGENFTQDETYYILDCKPGAKVYLGFQEDSNPEVFRKALLDALESGEEMDAEKYVQTFPAHRHDLFLIPNGTIHASGKDNLVLEISSTPYIFTFKMYDWQRLDLSGRPRPINIEHAFRNLYFDRKGAWVPENLLSRPVCLAETPTSKRWLLPTHPDHFYAVERHAFTGSTDIETGGQALVCMLVEGDAIEVRTGDRSHVFHYAETFVVPAAAVRFRATNASGRPALLVVAYVKDDHCA